MDHKLSIRVKLTQESAHKGGASFVDIWHGDSEFCIIALHR